MCAERTAVSVTAMGKCVQAVMNAAERFSCAGWQTCGIYECSVNNRKLKNCGECGNVPCEIWMKTRDPKFSDREFEDNVNGRIQALRKL